MNKDSRERAHDHYLRSRDAWSVAPHDLWMGYNGQVRICKMAGDMGELTGGRGRPGATDTPRRFAPAPAPFRLATIPAQSPALKTALTATQPVELPAAEPEVTLALEALRARADRLQERLLRIAAQLDALRTDIRRLDRTDLPRRPPRPA
jgi:hypothetical protein